MSARFWAVVGVWTIMQSGTACAETRVPRSPLEQFQLADVVFEGLVLQVEVVGTNVTENGTNRMESPIVMPVRATVSSVTKGRVGDGLQELSFTVPRPGRLAIFHEEFNLPRLGKAGRFYLQAPSGGGYRLIGFIEKKENNDPPLAVLPAMYSNVNARTTGDAIPWCTGQPGTIRLTGRFRESAGLVRTVRGDHHYTLYRVAYTDLKVLEGEFAEPELTFLLIRPFPTPESGIKLKELWPFHAGSALVFSITNEPGCHRILSVDPYREKGPE